MKIFSILSIVFLFGPLFLSGTTEAQPMQRGNRAEIMINTLRDSLDLSDDQLTKVKEIVTGTFEAMMQVREEAQGDREMMRQSIQELYTDMDNRIESLLNEDQKAKYQDIKDQRAQRIRNRVRPNRDGQQ